MSLFKKKKMEPYITNNFKYIVDYDSSGYSDCENYGCDDEGICRCYTIEEAHVTDNINLHDIVKKSINDLTPSGISKKRNDKLNLIFPNDDILDRYGIYRLSVIHKLWDSNLYSVEIEGGYYGQEIGDIILHESAFEKWSEDCANFYAMNEMKEKLFFLLEKEYGEILPNLLELNPCLRTISFSDIDWKSVNPNHVKNIRKKECPYYTSDYDLPRGIVRKTGNKYQLVDGYHRILKCPTDEFEVYSFE